MAPLLADLARMQAAIERMTSFGMQVQTCLQDVDHTVAALHATWHGDASDAQQQAQRQWDQGAEQMHDSLGQLQQALKSAHANYSDAAAKNLEMWDQ